MAEVNGSTTPAPVYDTAAIDREINQWNKSGKYDTVEWQNAAADASYAATLIETDPTGSLRKFFDWTAAYIKKNGAPPSAVELTRIKKQIPFFAQNDANVRQAAIEEATNPTGYKLAIQNNETTIAAAARKLGVELDPVTLTSLATNAKKHNWGAQEIQNNLAPKLGEALKSGRNVTGTAGEAQAQILDWARAQGLKLSADQIAPFVQRMAVGEEGINGVKEQLRNMYLKGMYPAWAKQISEGFDPSEIAAPYKQTMAGLLEIGNENDVSLDDPLMKRGLQGIDENGQPTTVPLWKFEQQVRNDPRWQYTNNAKAAYSSAADSLLTMFGLR